MTRLYLLHCFIEMPDSPNPYQPPTDSEPLLVQRAISGKLFVWLNIAIAATLAILVLFAFLWAKYDEARMAQQLGNRYVTYDHEYHVYPVSGIILLALVFGIPNVILLIVKFTRRRGVSQQSVSPAGQTSNKRMTI